MDCVAVYEVSQGWWVLRLAQHCIYYLESLNELYEPFKGFNLY